MGCMRLTPAWLVQNRASRSFISHTSNRPVYHNTLNFRLCSSASSQQQKDEPEPLYPGHIQSSIFQKALLAGGSALIALSNPWRADMVAVNGEVTGTLALKYMRDRFLQTEEGRQILQDKPRINGATLAALENQPPDTVGGVYFAFMNRYKLSPDDRDAVQFVDDPQLAYVMTRYRETHDLTHAVLGMPTNMLGEVLVKWVEASQTRLPMCIGGAIFGPIRFKSKQRELYTDLLPWALSVGTSASLLPAIYYEKHWDQNIIEFRAQHNIPEPPVV